MSKQQRICTNYQNFQCRFGSVCANMHEGPGASTPDAPGPEVGILYHQYDMARVVCKNYLVSGKCTHQGTAESYHCRLLHLDRQAFTKNNGAEAIRQAQAAGGARIPRATESSNAAVAFANNFSSAPPPGAPIGFQMLPGMGALPSSSSDASDQHLSPTSLPLAESSDVAGMPAAGTEIAASCSNFGQQHPSGLAPSGKLCTSWSAPGGCRYGAFCHHLHPGNVQGRFHPDAPSALAVSVFDVSYMCKSFLLSGHCALEQKNHGRKCTLNHFSNSHLKALAQFCAEPDMTRRIGAFLDKYVHLGSTLADVILNSPHCFGMLKAIIRNEAKNSAAALAAKRQQQNGSGDGTNNGVVNNDDEDEQQLSELYLNQLSPLAVMWCTLIGDDENDEFATVKALQKISSSNSSSSSSSSSSTGGENSNRRIQLDLKREENIVSTLNRLLNDDNGCFFLIELLSVSPRLSGGVPRALLRVALRLLTQRVPVGTSVARRASQSNAASRVVRFIQEFVYHDFLLPSLCSIVHELLLSSDGTFLIGQALRFGSRHSPARDAVISVVFSLAPSIVDHGSGSHVVADLIRVVASKEERGRWGFIVRNLWLHIEESAIGINELAMHRYAAQPLLCLAQSAQADVLHEIVAALAKVAEEQRSRMINDGKGVLFLEGLLSNEELQKGDCDALVQTLRPALKTVPGSKRLDTFVEVMQAAMRRTGLTVRRGRAVEENGGVSAAAELNHLAIATEPAAGMDMAVKTSSSSGGSPANGQGQQQQQQQQEEEETRRSSDEYEADIDARVPMVCTAESFVGFVPNKTVSHSQQQQQQRGAGSMHPPRLPTIPVQHDQIPRNGAANQQQQQQVAGSMAVAQHFMAQQTVPGFFPMPVAVPGFVPAAAAAAASTNNKISSSGESGGGLLQLPTPPSHHTGGSPTTAATASSSSSAPAGGVDAAPIVAPKPPTAPASVSAPAPNKQQQLSSSSSSCLRQPPPFLVRDGVKRAIPPQVVPVSWPPPTVPKIAAQNEAGGDDGEAKSPSESPPRDD